MYIRHENLRLWHHDMYLQLAFSFKAARLLVRQQGLDSPKRLRVFTDKNIDDICNVMRKPGSKNVNRTPDRGQQLSVITQENLKLAASLFHHRWRCTFDWEVTGVCDCIILHNRPVNVYCYNPKDCHRSAKTGDATVGYQDPQNGQKFILMINQAIPINGIENHLSYPMQCHLNGLYISEVPKFLAESHCVATHGIQLFYPFDAATLSLLCYS